MFQENLDIIKVLRNIKYTNNLIPKSNNRICLFKINKNDKLKKCAIDIICVNKFKKCVYYYYINKICDIISNNIYFRCIHT